MSPLRTSTMSPLFKARTAGFFWLMTFLTGGFAMFVGGSFIVPGEATATAANILAHESSFRLGVAANLIATACYVAVTALFYELFKPVNRILSLLAAFFSLVGCAIGALTLFHLAPFHISPLVFFGFYCLLIGYLIFRSTFLPRILGALMAFGGLGWLTFLLPQLANYLFPYNLAPGILGEGSLTLWLLVIGVNVPRWEEQASLERATESARR